MAVTPSEKKALELLVHVRKIDGISNLLRESSLAVALEDGERLLERLRAESEPARPEASEPAEQVA